MTEQSAREYLKKFDVEFNPSDSSRRKIRIPSVARKGYRTCIHIGQKTWGIIDYLKNKHQYILVWD